MGWGLENTERRASLSVEVVTITLLTEVVLKKEEDKQEAAASINAAAGTQLNSDWVETVNSELLALLNEAGS
ncbi:hypothetical protein P27p31 [Enterobacteria phage phiP27]|uniref:hypothetical protein n=1 Tax=Enterobacteria phage phiP27 TaxID=103807 RepID=UPI000009C0AF|nr:hypothetical protein P27p31 [Enterobacteria phage phiP27]KYU50560.1 hypothetical protein AML68_25715 [Escherichia coli]CAB93766.1 hypothetical protein [Enterobacteria phage phiP27]CAC83549.1 hypothetical protein [Enterobacteria phage phiP27]